MLGLRFVNVGSVKDARTVINSEHERRPPRFAKHFNRNFIGERNLLVINGREWKFHRGAVARTFNPKFLMESRAGMKDVAQTMVESLQRQIIQSPDGVKELDIEPLMKMITLDIFGQIALSTDFGLYKTLKPSPLVKAFEIVFITNRSFVADLINDGRDSLAEDDKDLLSHLIRAHHDVVGGKLKSDEAMTDILMTLLFAGYDTTSVTLTFALYLLAQNQDVQQRCVEEINAVKTIENVEELVYTKAVIWEVLRLYPAGVRTNRTLVKDIQLQGGLVVPAGTRVNIPIWNIHRDEKISKSPRNSAQIVGPSVLTTRPAGSSGILATSPTLSQQERSRAKYRQATRKPCWPFLLVEETA